MSALNDPFNTWLSDLTDESSRDLCIPQTSGLFVEARKDRTVEEVKRDPVRIRSPFNGPVNILVGGSDGVLFIGRLLGVAMDTSVKVSLRGRLWGYVAETLSTDAVSISGSDARMIWGSKPVTDHESNLDRGSHDLARFSDG